MPSLKKILQRATGYVRRRPADGLRILRSALSLRIAVPVDALRWFAEESGASQVRDVAIREAPPGIRASASVHAMGTPIRAGATLEVESVTLGEASLRVVVVIRDVELELLDESVRTPVAALIKSGALDLSRPANLLAHMPDRPAMVVEAEGERIVLDIMLVPRLAVASALKRLLPVLAECLEVRSLAVDQGFIELAVGVMPRGFAAIRDRLTKVA